MTHLDSNGAELQVGDIVRYGKAEGKVLILENWDPDAAPSLPDAWQTAFGVYVTNIGAWGDCRALPASLVTRVRTAAQQALIDNRPAGVTREQALRYPSTTQEV